MIARGSSRLRLLANYLSFVISSILIGSFKLKDYKFDLIFAFEPSPVFVGIPAVYFKWLKKAKLIFWVLDLWPQTPIALKVIKTSLMIGFIEKIVKWIYNNCDLILAQSKSFISAIKKYTSGNINIEYFPAWNEEKILYKNIETDISNKEYWKDYFCIGFTGNIGIAQDFDTIIKASELLVCEKIKWIIIGNGSKLEYLKSKISESRCKNNWEILGRMSKMEANEYVNKCDALLVSLKDEYVFSLTIPSKVQYYMSFKKPILSIANGETKLIVEDSRCGFACNAGDYSALAHNILKLKSYDEIKRRKLGQNGYNFLMKEFNREKLFNELNTKISLITKK